MREIWPREVALSAQALGHATEDLRGDDARVAPRAHERPEADGLCDPVGRRIGYGVGFGQCGLDGGEHVAAGIAIGHGVHVERVDLVDMGGQVFD